MRRDYTVTVVHMPLPKDMCALAVYRAKAILLDCSRDENPAKVFIHELIHFAHADWSEPKVRSLENKIWKLLTFEEKLQLLRELFS